ncbi:MAG: hypothetical protein EOO14_01390 [Chitinophagaceae bacterium]|nr:MAG: hypothetical protein EOO14_01390 [Chitinophagaceae bacterium]
MRVFIFKYGVQLVYALTATVLVLAVAALLLYKQNCKAQTVNRVLVLQNDSILSENIALKHAILQQEVKGAGKKDRLSVK